MPKMLDQSVCLSDRGGKRREWFVRLVDNNRFRFCCCDVVRTIHSGETLEQAVEREAAGITRRTWPDAPEFWIDPPLLGCRVLNRPGSMFGTITEELPSKALLIVWEDGERSTAYPDTLRDAGCRSFDPLGGWYRNANGFLQVCTQ